MMYMVRALRAACFWVVFFAYCFTGLCQEESHRGQDFDGFRLRELFWLPEIQVEFPRPDGWSWEQREKEYGFRVFGLEHGQFIRCLFRDIPSAAMTKAEIEEVLPKLNRELNTGLTSEELHRWIAKTAVLCKRKNGVFSTPHRLTVVLYETPNGDTFTTNDSEEGIRVGSRQHAYPTKSVVMIYEPLPN